ncbi:MAG: GSCFA domain-containing protein, partial [Flavobacteriaceae bacterium]
MKLITEIPLEKQSPSIDYGSKLLLLGSCFAGHMADKLNYFKFQTLVNPFGILFHPVAMENLVRRAMSQQLYTESELI